MSTRLTRPKEASSRPCELILKEAPQRRRKISLIQICPDYITKSLNHPFKFLHRLLPNRHAAEAFPIGADGPHPRQIPQTTGWNEVPAKLREEPVDLRDLVTAHVPYFFLRRVAQAFGPFVMVVQKVARFEKSYR